MIREKLRLPGGGSGGRSCRMRESRGFFGALRRVGGSSGRAGNSVKEPFQPAQQANGVGRLSVAVSPPRNRHPRPPWVRHRSPRPTAGPPQGDPLEGSAGTEPMGVRDPLNRWVSAIPPRSPTFPPRLPLNRLPGQKRGDRKLSGLSGTASRSAAVAGSPRTQGPPIRK